MAALDRFGTFSPDLIGPMRSAVAVTPSDANDLAEVTRAVYVGGAGNLNVDMADGTNVVFTAIAVGVIHGLRVKRIRSTSTTATVILALY